MNQISWKYSICLLLRYYQQRILDCEFSYRNIAIQENCAIAKMTARTRLDII